MPYQTGETWEIFSGLLIASRYDLLVRGRTVLWFASIAYSV